MPAVIQPIGLPLWIPAAYLALISLVSVCATVWDKCAARRHRRRIPEANLLLLGLLGGSLCMFITMKAIRHKTLHKKFMIGLPLILALQLFLIAALWFLPAFRQAYQKPSAPGRRLLTPSYSLSSRRVLIAS